jgi:hypothetical protein
MVVSQAIVVNHSISQKDHFHCHGIKTHRKGT